MGRSFHLERNYMDRRYFRLSYNIMILPSVIFLCIFSIWPIIGSSIAFQRFIGGRGFFGSPWVGLENFRLLFDLPVARQVIWNTVIISLLKGLAHFPVQIGFALALNELRNVGLKRVIQTSVNMPHFISWVIVGEIVRSMLMRDGIVNGMLGSIGFKPVDFMSNAEIFRFIIVGSDLWKSFGFSSIIYIAALSRINPNLYEACRIDGGRKWHEIRHVSLPGIKSVIVLFLALGIGNILNTGFDQIYNLYNPLVYRTVDVLDTFVYRAGILRAQYSFATAVGLFKSVISFSLVTAAYAYSYKYANYRIF